MKSGRLKVNLYILEILLYSHMELKSMLHTNNVEIFRRTMELVMHVSSTECLQSQNDPSWRTTDVATYCHQRNVILIMSEKRLASQVSRYEQVLYFDSSILCQP